MNLERKVAFRLRLMLLNDDVATGCLSADAVREELRIIDRHFGTDLDDRYQVVTVDGTVTLTRRTATPAYTLWGGYTASEPT